MALHALVNRSIQVFVSEVYGADSWAAIVAKTPRGIKDFHALEAYSPEIHAEVLAAASEVLTKPVAALLEDLGTWLVTSQTLPIRRLLRFAGTDFVEFLHSLDDLPGRARLAVRKLEVPPVELREHAPFTYSLTMGPQLPGFGHFMLGLLRAMADDYGVLALIDHAGGGAAPEVLNIRLVQTDYTQGRAFELALP